MIELISHTSTQEGWQVTASKDSQTYPTGLTVSDAELKALTIVRDAFHGEWHDTITPQDTLSPYMLPTHGCGRDVPLLSHDERLEASSLQRCGTSGLLL